LHPAFAMLPAPRTSAGTTSARRAFRPLITMIRSGTGPGYGPAGRAPWVSIQPPTGKDPIATARSGSSTDPAPAAGAGTPATHSPVSHPPPISSGSGTARVSNPVVPSPRSCPATPSQPPKQGFACPSVHPGAGIRGESPRRGSSEKSADLPSPCESRGGTPPESELCCLPSPPGKGAGPQFSRTLRGRYSRVPSRPMVVRAMEAAISAPSPGHFRPLRPAQSATAFPTEVVLNG
jgi:hypothetical protein